MDSRLASGRHASTSHVCTSFRGRRSVCCRASRDNVPEGFPSCRFPTTQVTGQDWRAFRAHLVAWEHSAKLASERSSQLQRPPYPPLVSGDSWAHPLPEPEQGCLLLARHDNMQFFSGAVILITSHDNAAGSVGYVLNKPSPLKVDELQVLGAATGFKEAFGCQRLHLGGPVHLDHVTLLHRFGGISRCHKIADGMFMGGLPDAIRLVKSGLLRPSDFHLVLGMCGWAAGQLRDEVSAGYWHVVSASPDLVLPSATWSPASSVSATPSPSCSASSSPCSAASGASPSSPSYAAPSPSSSSCGGTADGRQQQEQQQGQGQGADGSSRGVGRAGHMSPMYRRIARLAVRGV